MSFILGEMVEYRFALSFSSSSSPGVGVDDDVVGGVENKG